MLVRLARLKPDLEREISADARFDQNWLLVQEWSEEGRYQQHAEKTARDLFKAITDRDHGVMRWIRRFW